MNTSQLHRNIYREKSKHFSDSKKRCLERFSKKSNFDLENIRRGQTLVTIGLSRFCHNLEKKYK